MGPQLKVSSDREDKPRIEPATPGLQDEWFILCTMAASFIYFKYSKPVLSGHPKTRAAASIRILEYSKI